MAGPAAALTASPPAPAAALADSALSRLWFGFMTARVTIAMVLLLLHASVLLMGQPSSPWALPLCTVYLVACLAVRLLLTPPASTQSFDAQWPLTIGIDVLGCAVLQFTQSAGINYIALFALPVLLASVLGTRLLGLGTAAAITLLLFVQASWHAAPAEAAYLQAGLVGTGLMAEALLAHQLAHRLASQEALAWRSAQSAAAQSRVNELIIENLPDGILVVDSAGRLQVINPAARRMLLRGQEGRREPAAQPLPTTLFAEPGWYGLATLVQDTLARQVPQAADVSLDIAGTHLRLRASTQLTAATPTADSTALCVLFLQDLRELEARMRTDNLAAMGRMSTAVAHEIRNPLAAIAQANALLGEDLPHPQHQRLTRMIQNNAQRLNQIVEEVLNLSRIPPPVEPPPLLLLDTHVAQYCTEWMQQTGHTERVQLALAAPGTAVRFNGDHLRRVLINLLDNAQRYTHQHGGAVVVSTQSDGPEVQLSVWSEAAPLEASVQRHLFEPFFSSESRSTGLGLYICRELCEQHGASIAYRRRSWQGTDGNDFHVRFSPSAASARPVLPAPTHTA